MMDSFTKKHVNAYIDKLYALADDTKSGDRPPFVCQAERVAYENALRYAIKMRDALTSIPKGDKGDRAADNQQKGQHL